LLGPRHMAQRPHIVQPVRDLDQVLADAFKLTWISSTMHRRPQLISCPSDPLAAAPFVPGSRSWAAQALQDLGIAMRLVELPDEIRQSLLSAQQRQSR